MRYLDRQTEYRVVPRYLDITDIEYRVVPCR